MKNVIVQYEGGGYSGCFYELNYFAYDCNGNFHNIYSTGRNGIQKESQAERILGEDETTVYNIPDDILEFVDSNNAQMILHLYRTFLSDIFPDNDIWIFTCQETGLVLPLELAVIDENSYSSDGGLRISGKSLICDEVNDYRRLGFKDGVFGLDVSLDEDDPFYGCYYEYYQQGELEQPDFDRDDIIHAYAVFAVDKPNYLSIEKVLTKINRMGYALDTSVISYDTLSSNAQIIYEMLVIRFELEDDIMLNHLWQASNIR